MNRLLLARTDRILQGSRVLQWVLDSMGPTGDRKDAKAKSAGILKRLGHTDLKLNEYEGACVVQS